MERDYYKRFFESGQAARWLVDVRQLENCACGSEVDRRDGTHVSLGSETGFAKEGRKMIRTLGGNGALFAYFEVDNLEGFRAIAEEAVFFNGNRLIPELIRHLKEAKTGGTFEIEINHPAKGRRFLRVYADVLPDEEIKPAVLTLFDITEESLKQWELHESMEKYRLLITAANDAIIICDDETGMIEEINPKAVDLFTREESECLGMDHNLLFPEEELERYREYYSREMSSSGSGEVLTTFVQQSNGEQIPVEINLAGADIADRRLVQISFHDVRKRRKLEERRRLLATAVDQAAESVMITDPDGMVEYVNPAFEKTSGYSFAEVLGKTPAFLKSRETSKLTTNLLWKEISTGKVWQGTFTNRRKDGTLYKEQATITPVRDANGHIQHYVTVKRDITQQTALEQQVRQSQKMQAIGTLAGGVAHDFNNILTAILGYAELTQARCEQNTIMYDNLAEVIKAAERAGRLIDQILQFSRQSEKSTSSLQIDLIVKEVLKLLRASLPANIEIVSDLETGSFVKADPTQMHQVVMNLCTNAYQALETTGGEIKVSLKTETLSLRQGVEIGNLDRGDYICITVSDNGVGIPKEYLPRIFEPYFTTRAQNEGTGLGLSVVHGIINDHGGAVTVDSEIGKGAIFKLYLPQSEYMEEEVEADDENAMFGAGRILVVDDEPNIVNFQVQVLEHFGYEVVACTTSGQAVEIFKEKDGGFDLVITDMGMPGMTGLELLTELRAINQDVKVMLCTGYSKQVTAENAEEKGLAGYLAKPFNAHQLVSVVSRLVNVEV